MLEKMVNVDQATHVKLKDGTVERIKSTWGIDQNGRLAPPSKGGFGVVTESGKRVGMFEALAYYKRQSG
jgi:hypothetical protein